MEHFFEFSHILKQTFFHCFFCDFFWDILRFPGSSSHPVFARQVGRMYILRKEKFYKTHSKSQWLLEQEAQNKQKSNRIRKEKKCYVVICSQVHWTESWDGDKRTEYEVDKKYQRFTGKINQSNENLNGIVNFDLHKNVITDDSIKLSSLFNVCDFIARIFQPSFVTDRCRKNMT